MKWQSGKDGSVGCGGVVIKHSPTLRIRGFLGNRSHDLRLSEFFATARWAVTWAFAQPWPVSLIYLRNLLWLTEYSLASLLTVTAQ